MATKQELLQKLASDFSEIGEPVIIEESEKDFGMRLYKVPVMVAEGDVMRSLSLIIHVKNEGTESEKAFLNDDPGKDNKIRRLVQKEIAKKEADGSFFVSSIETIDAEKEYAIVGAYVKTSETVIWKRFLAYNKNGIKFEEIDVSSSK